MSTFKTAERNLRMQRRRLFKDIESMLTVATSSEGLTKEGLLIKNEKLGFLHDEFAKNTYKLAN